MLFRSAKDCAQTVELLELLYQVPPLYHLNVAELQKRKGQIKRHYDFFSPLHRETGLLPMSDFQWLTPDGTVQKTLFGNSIELIANFSTNDFQAAGATVSKGSVLAKWRGEEKSQAYSPQ